MRVFVYEHITGGGTLAAGAGMAPAGCLLTEGAAMVRALAADFAAIPGVEVSALRDARLERFSLQDCHLRAVADARGHEFALNELAAECDATLVVAPEAGGVLQKCCRQVAAAGGRIISPGEPEVETASDKLRLARCLADAGVPVPLTRRVKSGQPLPIDFPYPAVLKPIRGAGSIDVHRIRTSADWHWPVASGRHDGWILQPLLRGTPVSVAILCRRSGRHPLVPCRQRLSRDGRFQYRGGDLPLPPDLADRAILLGEAAVARALPGVVGYVGVDLVLGETGDARRDFVIEINPRLTTSYVGLRVAALGNLAEAMLDVANDERPDVRFSGQPLQFDADGTVRRGCDLEGVLG